MGRLKTIGRRAFLVGSAAVVGGVAFGFYLYKKPVENPLLADLGSDEAALTPYVKIDAEGVTLITPRADKGQGAYSVQAAMIAEELDAELDQIRVDPGVPSPAYWNRALADEAVPFAATDHGAMATAARGTVGAVMKIMGMQVTGGSSTVADGFEKLRIAGAVARETLKAAAAQKTGVAVARLRTQGGAVILPDGTEIPYQELAAEASRIEPVTEVALRQPEQWRLIGKPMLRVDTVAKSTGTLHYGIDAKLNGMVHAAVVLNPRQGGVLNSYDASAAKDMRGVKKIVPVTGGVGVIADNTWRAFQAAAAVECEWGPAVFAPEMADHWAELEQAFDTDPDSRGRDEGDVENTLGETPLTAEYRAPYLAHAPLEPINAVVLIKDGRVDVWTGTQVPRFTQNNVAAIAGVEPEQVHIHAQMMGGSFGHRLEDEVARRCAELAMEMKGVPVKLTFSREQDFGHDYLRPAAIARMRGAVAGGTVKTFDLDVSAPSVLTSQMAERQGMPMPGPDSSISQALWDQPYGIENYRVTAHRAQNMAPVSSWRSVGASQNAFFHEGFLSELITAAGGDQLEQRIALCTDDVSRRVLQTVGEMSDWGRDLGPDRGRGVAFCMSFGTPVAEVVEVTNSPDGIRIDNVFVATDVGRVIDPVNFENLVQGGVVFGLGHAMNCEITISDGGIEQTNFHEYEGMRMYQCPRITVKALERNSHIRGIGEPPVPPAAPALASAIFDATGVRLREMPFNKFVDFV
ncbi:xanthine dehydrogenase family protein molybdopterin-binding subunit [Neptunicoccus cionae]|uniref:xanthine dehydrogenase family protein molybdopterin-binding subunit n=1 Tax=Neptunicoccus cionae TaxID=2035344 RepID=UPI000C7668E4|nr:molybdopterin cofactor-binding domain-containing protein [Amylibacter cionae]PLS22697.1 isoquinoline 1-oxidoreductase [Amylibacter cionae]